MNEGLTENHTILGIHMEGNRSKTDSLGFIVPDHVPDRAITHVHTRMKPELNIGQIKNKLMLDLKANSNCWICEGWTKVKFEWNLGISSNHHIDPEKGVYVHLSSDDYKGDLLLLDPD